MAHSALVCGAMDDAVEQHRHRASTSAGLTGVDARSSSDVWAVGNTGLVFGYNYMQRVMHWNGSAWTDFSMPPYLVLTGVALASPPDNVWAVGGLIDAGNHGK